MNPCGISERSARVFIWLDKERQISEQCSHRNAGKHKLEKVRAMPLRKLSLLIEGAFVLLVLGLLGESYCKKLHYPCRSDNITCYGLLVHYLCISCIALTLNLIEF